MRYGSVDYQGNELYLYNNWYILFGASNDRKRTKLSVPDIKETEVISELTPIMTVKDETGGINIEEYITNRNQITKVPNKVGSFIRAPFKSISAELPNHHINSKNRH